MCDEGRRLPHLAERTAGARTIATGMPTAARLAGEHDMDRCACETMTAHRLTVPVYFAGSVLLQNHEWR